MATLPYCKATPYRAHVRGGQAVLLAVGAPALNGTPPTVKIGGVNAPALAWDMDQGTLVVRAPPGSGSPTVRIEHALLDGGYQDFSGVLDYVSSLRKLYPASLTASVAAPAHPGAAAGWIVGTGQTPQKVGAAAPAALANGLSANAILLPECVPADQVTRSGLCGAPSAGGAFSNYADANGPFLQGQFVTFPLYGVTSIPAGTWRFRGASCTWFDLYGSQGDQLCIFIRHMDGTVTTVLDTSTETARRAYTISSSYVWRTIGYDITLPQIALQDGDQIGFEWWGRNYSASTGQWAYFSMDGDATPDLSPLADGAVAGSDPSNDRPAAFIELPADLYDAPLSIASITPSSGPTIGGTAVTLTGSGFTDATGATIGGVSLTGFVVVNDTTITGVTGAHAAGAVDVVVTVGAETATLAGGYTYVDSLAISPSHGPASGGAAVTLTANGWFAPGAVVTVSGGAVAAVVQSASAITFTAPAHSAGPVVVSVASQGITKTATFTYDLVVTPNSGPDTGGTTVRVIGVAAGSPTFGGIGAASVSSGDWNSILCVTPPHAPGAVNVVVNAITAANAFTYVSTLPEVDASGCAPILTLGTATSCVGLGELSNLEIGVGAGEDLLLLGMRMPLAVAAGFLRGAEILVERAYMADREGPVVGTYHVFEGRVEADASSTALRLSIESFAAALKSVLIPRTPIQEKCPNQLCDEACGLDPAALTVPAVAQVSGYRTSVATLTAAVLETTPGRFTNGVLVVTSGACAGERRTIALDFAYNGLRGFDLSTLLPAMVQTGDTFTVFPDCSKTIAACSAFGNRPRFRGQPFIPTEGQVATSTPPVTKIGMLMRFLAISESHNATFPASGTITFGAGESTADYQAGTFVALSSALLRDLNGNHPDVVLDGRYLVTAVGPTSLTVSGMPTWSTSGAPGPALYHPIGPVTISRGGSVEVSPSRATFDFGDVAGGAVTVFPGIYPGCKVTIAGHDFTAIRGTTNSDSWAVESGSMENPVSLPLATCAANLAAVINASTLPGIAGVIRASAAGGRVVLGNLSANPVPLVVAGGDAALIAANATDSWWRGAWSGTVTYAKTDVATYGGNTYIALEPSTNVAPTDAAHWALVASGESRRPIANVGLGIGPGVSVKISAGNWPGPDGVTRNRDGVYTVGEVAPHELGLVLSAPMFDDWATAPESPYLSITIERA